MVNPWYNVVLPRMDVREGRSFNLHEIAIALTNRYPRLSTDRQPAESHDLEWVTPGHPLFEALRRHAQSHTQESLAAVALSYSVEHAAPARIDFYRARIVDGLARTE
ncbi:MAG TPA: hypothetical protein VJ692_06150 [Nitrospiraceae bacterium]|nr:hypothetical protein [Nitrospiraceae bacterium]